MREMRVGINEWNVMKQVCKREEYGFCGEEKRESYCKDEKECGIISRMDEKNSYSSEGAIRKMPDIQND